MASAGAAHLSAVLGRRAAAALAAFSAGLHGLMAGHVDSIVGATLILAMMTACLYCARDLWLSGSLRAWCVVALMSLGMVAIHWSVPGCHPGTVIDTAASTTPLMMIATSAALLEATIATAVLFYRTKDRASALGLDGAAPRRIVDRAGV